MCFPKSISRINNSCLTSFFVSLTLIFIVIGCSVTKIYKEISPSPQSLSNTKSIFLEKFSGIQSNLFEKILNHEIKKQAIFKNIYILPEISEKKSAIMNAKVTRYALEDIEKIVQKKQVILVEKKVPRNNHSNQKIFNRKFDFVEKTYKQRVIHRIVDLEIFFHITNVSRDKELYSDSENASLKLSYVGDDKILLIPDPNDEMARLAQLLIRKFLDKINPNPKEHIIVLEKGSNPIPWTLNFIDFGHPRILRSNHYAIGNRYNQAIKGWNYVLFEPRTFPDSELFIFSDDVFLRLKKAGLPQSILKNLFGLHGKSFDKDEINVVLLGFISNKDFGKYSKIIKFHSRFSENLDRINLASAHYNLGTIFQLRDELDLAGYHFAQANAYNPNEKYSQAWIDVQHLRGNYNPFEKLMDNSIDSLGEIITPERALLHPKK